MGCLSVSWARSEDATNVSWAVSSTVPGGHALEEYDENFYHQHLLGILCVLKKFLC